MGEIGYDRDRFLYDLQLWEIRLIIKGYRNRAHTSWETMRWQTWAILCALGSKGINDPQTLLRFPWEEDSSDVPEDDEVERIRKELQRINAEGGIG